MRCWGSCCTEGTTLDVYGGHNDRRTGGTDRKLISPAWPARPWRPAPAWTAGATPLCWCCRRTTGVETCPPSPHRGSGWWWFRRRGPRGLWPFPGSLACGSRSVWSGKKEERIQEVKVKTHVYLISPLSTRPISLHLFPAFIVLFNKYFNLTLKFLTEWMESFVTMTFPPPGMWLALSREPTLAWALSLKSSFTFSIRMCPPPGKTTESREASFQKAPHFPRAERDKKPRSKDRVSLLGPLGTRLDVTKS